MQVVGTKLDAKRPPRAPGVITITRAAGGVQVSILGWRQLQSAGAETYPDAPTAARYAHALAQATGFHILANLSRTARHG